MSESEKSTETNTTETNTTDSFIDEAESFMDVPVCINIQLATRNMKVRDILQLQESSILELPKSAGENVDILVNDKPLADGEVLELEGTTGIRLTDFIQEF